VIATATERIVANPLAGDPPVWEPHTRAPLDFHRRLPGYAPTPLVVIPSLAQRLGVREVLVKVESTRLGLPAFKMLGASWATYRALVGRLGYEPSWGTVADLAEQLRSLRPFTLAAATDGNHGQAVAVMARLLGFDARIFVPEGTVAARIASIAGEGATVTVVDGDYDATVARSAQEAGPSCLVISDTSWPGYDQVPRWVVEGYSTMMWEIDDALARRRASTDDRAVVPDAVIVPMGVGALTAAVVNHWGRHDENGPHARGEIGSGRRDDSGHAGSERPHDSRPVVVGVEPVDAACIMASVLAGRITTVPGPHRSIMAGLNCGTPSPVAWPLVSAGVRTLVAVDDDRARQAVRDFAAFGVEAGETGAAALAGLTLLQSHDQPLPATATVLLLCTEGATDREGWWRILGVDVV
jgi:diaminopropionate ammonia-lyase